MEKIYTNPEKDFTIVFTWKPPDPNHDTFNAHPHWVEFVVYEVTGETDTGEPLYTNDLLADLSKAEQWCHGHIKLDGCMEIHDFTAHFCGWSRKLEYLMRDIYLEGATILDEWRLEEYRNLGELKQHYNVPE